MRSSSSDAAPRLTLIQGRADEAAPRDARIVIAVREGEAGAAAQLYDRARPIVDKTLRRLVGGADPDYPDLAQNALIELAATLHRFRGECSLDTWIATITSRLVYKQFRRRAVERRLFAVLEDDAVELPGVSAARAAIAKSLLARVVEILRSMDRGRAWAYWLHDACGHDLREVAEIMSISVAAAQSRLVRGRKELHARIEKDPELARGLEEMER